MSELRPAFSDSAQPFWGRGKKQFVTGCGIYAVLIAIFFAGPALDEMGLAEVLYLPAILGCLFVLPLIGLILAIIQSTRMLGISFLLGGGVSWLILIAVCGGINLGS